MTSRVLIVEDHAVVTFTLSQALRAHGLEVTAAPLESVDALLEAARALLPSVALCDLDLGGAIGDGRDLVGALTATGARVVILTGWMDWHRIAECLELGATDFVIKSEPFETLLAAVDEAVAGGTRLRASQRDRLLVELARHRDRERSRLAALGQLTAREQRVLAGLMEGLQAEAIAEEDGVSEATIRSQIRGVLTKLGVTSQLAAVAAARRAGWGAKQVAS